MRINNNISAMNTHRQYTINNSSVAKITEKLSSGYRINRAGDDAAGLAISEKMRAQIRGLTMASKNSQDAISLVQTAEGALQESHNILQRMRELAVQSASDTNETTIDRDALNKEFQALVAELDDTANKTRFNDMNLLDGSYGSSYATALSNTTNMAVRLGQGATAGTYNIKGSYTAATTSITSAGTVATVNYDSLLNTGAVTKFEITGATAANANNLTGTNYSDDTGTGAFRIVDAVADPAGGNSITLSFEYTNGTVTDTFSYVLSLNNPSTGTGQTVNVDIGNGNMLEMEIAAGASVNDVANAIKRMGTQDVGTGGLTNFIGTTALSGFAWTAGTAKSELLNGEWTLEFDNTAGANSVTARLVGPDGKFYEAAAINLLGAAGTTVTLDFGAGIGTLDFDVAATSTTLADEITADLNRLSGSKIYVTGSTAPVLETTPASASITVNGIAYQVNDGDTGINTVEGFSLAFSQAFNASSHLASETSFASFIGLDSNLEGSFSISVDNNRAGLTIQTGANEGDSLEVFIDRMDSGWLGVAVSSIASKDSASKAITEVNDALNIVSTQRAALGALQNRLQHKINNLDTSAENLSAAESRIRDLDMAQAMTEFTKSQIMSSAATAMLAQANALPQSVLQLLQ